MREREVLQLRRNAQRQSAALQQHQAMHSKQQVRAWALLLAACWCCALLNVRLLGLICTCIWAPACMCALLLLQSDCEPVHRDPLADACTLHGPVMHQHSRFSKPHFFTRTNSLLAKHVHQLQFIVHSLCLSLFLYHVCRLCSSARQRRLRRHAASCETCWSCRFARAGTSALGRAKAPTSVVSSCTQQQHLVFGGSSWAPSAVVRQFFLPNSAHVGMQSILA
jgi:hypothetical protein